MLSGKLKSLIMLAGDIAIYYGALWLTLLIRQQSLPDSAIWEQHLLPFSLLFLVWVAVFFINSLYDLTISGSDVNFYNKLLRSMFINFGLAAAYFYLLTDRLFDIKPRAIFFIFIGLTAIIIPLWRRWYNSFIRNPNLLRNVAVFGINDETIELIKEIIRKPQLGYRLKVIVHDGAWKGEEFPTILRYRSSENIKQVLQENNIQTVVTTLDPRTNPQLLKNLYQSIHLKLQFFDLPSFYELLTGKIPVTNIGHIWFLENLAESEKTFYEFVKRVIDLITSVVVLLIALPFIPLIALAIKVNSAGPVFFRQTRVGVSGKPFLAIKFRSMVQGAERDGQPQWAQKNDPRVTRIGRFLRKTRIDEIPQLWNVLKGEMSLIGPRPERPEFVRELEKIIPFYNERHLVKPGLTGCAQVNFRYGASAGDALKKLQYDLFYIKNRSLPLDIGLVLKTINIILTGKGH